MRPIALVSAGIGARLRRLPGVRLIGSDGAYLSGAKKINPSTLCDERDNLASAECYRGDDAPAVIDGLAPPFIVAVGSVPGSLFAGFPSFAHIFRVGHEKAARLQCLQPAVDFNPIMTGAAVEPSASASIHAARDVGDGRTEFIFLERHRGKRSNRQGDYNGQGVNAHRSASSTGCEHK